MPDHPADSAAFDDAAAAAVESAPTANAQEGGAAPSAPARRGRPKPGERRMQILQALAGMLEQPGTERITTAALAARLDVSEAALYRHFASKAQMFEGLIDFIEESVFTRVRPIVQAARGMADGGDSQAGADGAHHAARICALVLQFGARNPGMVRVMVGDALVLENDRLLQRMSQFFDRIESSLRQCLRPAAEAAGSATPTVDAQVRAAALCDLLRGRLQRYARTGFARSPVEHMDATLQLWLAPGVAAAESCGGVTGMALPGAVDKLGER